MNLEVMHVSTFPGLLGVVDGGDISGLTRENELQVGQQFCDKEAVLFSIKNCNIQRSVESKVLELDHIKYYDKCKHFGMGVVGVYM